tara:strand:+ start:370 stop:603 length:234 start_codon:yes stop_codon:yes gene_type:complete
MSEYMTQENRFDFEKVLMLPNPGVAMHDALEELERCYEKIDWLQKTADLAADNIGRKNWDGFEEAMYEAGLWERPSE